MSAGQSVPRSTPAGVGAPDEGVRPATDCMVIAGPRSGPTLFCIPPATGVQGPYLGLADYLAGRSVYGLQTVTDAGDPQHARGIPELADALVAEIRARQPDGPYHLLGWSFGGLVAHAIATRMQLEGDAVGFLAVLNGHPHGPQRFRQGLRLQDLAEWTLVGAAEPCRCTPTQPAASSASSGRPGEPWTAGGRRRTLQAAIRRSYQLRRDYLPQRFAGQLTLIVATGNGRSGLDMAVQWQHHCAAVQFHEVPCAPHQLLGPQGLRVVGPLVAGHLAATPDAAP